jgi:streptogramin lyase
MVGGVWADWLPRRAVMMTADLVRVGTQATTAVLLLATADSQPDGLVEGPDGALWFGESAANANAIARLDVKSVGKPEPARNDRRAG